MTAADGPAGVLATRMGCVVGRGWGGGVATDVAGGEPAVGAGGGGVLASGLLPTAGIDGGGGAGLPPPAGGASGGSGVPRSSGWSGRDDGGGGGPGGISVPPVTCMGLGVPDIGAGGAPGVATDLSVPGAPGVALGVNELSLMVLPLDVFSTASGDGVLGGLTGDAM